MLEAAKHDGTSVVEILQNCVIFNDGTHNLITNRETKDDMQLVLKHGEKMIFGKEKNKGIKLGAHGLEVVTIGENGATIDDVLVHDMYNQSPGLHLNLSKMLPPEFPVALGVIRSAVSDTYCEMLQDSIDEQKEKNPIKCVDDLLNSGDTWVI
jgi:2-oxoglutarate/2-oxoacid ferredoxin oxidoreductase subunit beta